MLSSIFHKQDNVSYGELVVTEKCFFRCKMCMLWKTEKEETPSLDEWKGYISSLSSHVKKPFRLGIVGGETLLYPHLAELVRFSSSKGFIPFITTNGYLLDMQKAKELKDAGLSEIIISLDSLDPNLHDEIRGKKGSFAKVMEAIDNAHSAGLDVNLIAVVMSLNISGLPELVIWAQKNSKVRSISFNAVTEPLNSGAGQDWHAKGEYSYLWPADLAGMEKLIAMKETYTKIGNSERQLVAFRNYFKEPEKFVIEGNCTMGSSVSVNSEGHMFMCHRKGSFGNIKHDRFKDAWRSGKAKDQRRWIIQCRQNCKMLVNCNYS
ncbi:MAG: radical SAM protein [Nanoarchaeota archaeon]|nr:radical SAM protein [Nanoarchaeota archaeon]